MTCLFRAHFLEDRVLKIDRVKIRNEATVGTGGVYPLRRTSARCQRGAAQRRHEHEKLLPRRTYAGAPTRAMA